jgi:DNA-binding protein HU-beta
MNRRELVNAVAAQSGLETKQVDAAIRSFTDVVTAVVSKGEPVAITGFAKFAKVERAARMGRNPQTGEPVKIKASKKARITPLKGFKDAVMTPSTAPKLDKGVWPPAPVVKKAAPAKKAPAAKKVAPAKKAAPVKKAAVAKKVAPAKKAAPVKKSPVAKKAAPVRKR